MFQQHLHMKHSPDSTQPTLGIQHTPQPVQQFQQQPPVRHPAYQLALQQLRDSPITSPKLAYANHQALAQHESEPEQNQVCHHSAKSSTILLLLQKASNPTTNQVAPFPPLQASTPVVATSTAPPEPASASRPAPFVPSALFGGGQVGVKQQAKETPPPLLVSPRPVGSAAPSFLASPLTPSTSALMGGMIGASCSSAPAPTTTTATEMLTPHPQGSSVPRRRVTDKVRQPYI